jgi:streptomycin 6-kinase
LTAALIDDWQLRVDGEAIRGSGAEVYPVRTAEGARAVLKLGHSAHEHLVLRRWNGDGAVRLLRADPHRRAVLLERLQPERLPADHCEVVADLYGRLHVAAMPQLPSVPELLGRWGEEFAALPRSAPIPHRLVAQAAALCRDLAEVPADHVLHGNLHYDNVLAADRQPWLAISPVPVNGDPAYEVAPLLWQRWNAVADDVRSKVQRRLFTVVDRTGFDEDRVRAWSVVRVVRQAVDDPVNLTRYVAVAKAIQD